MKTNIENIKNKYIMNRVRIICFLSLILIHILDMITTIIGISFGAVETNPITSQLFTLGTFGFILGSMYVIAIFIACFFVIEYSFILYQKTTYESCPYNLRYAIYIGFTIILVLGISHAVFNNLRIIIFYLL
ncbi:MAG TPA: hypothetical protein ENH46_06900 [Candidatus Pacearchaeota archaeon]|nr:hypothetical protein [Candidatus Pacearchaeota archaeon]